MIGRRFERLKGFMRWFFNASPDWSESRNHVTEPEPVRSVDNDSREAPQMMSKDTMAHGDMTVTRRKDR